MTQVLESVGPGVPAALVEVITVDRTLNKRADDVLVNFDNGPTAAINRCLEHLRGSRSASRTYENA